jgi:hypothetical protein
VSLGNEADADQAPECLIDHIGFELAACLILPAVVS